MSPCAIAATVVVTLTLALGAGVASAQDDDAGAGDDDAGVGTPAGLCNTDAECDAGLVCRAELGSYCGDLGCTSEPPRCLPPPLYCETDAACPPGLSCAQGVATQCWLDPSLPGGCVAQPIGLCMAGAPAPTAGRYRPCESDGDCDPGYSCRAEGGSICSVPPAAPGCVPSGPLRCIPEGMPCQTDRDCPSSWICAEPVPSCMFNPFGPEICVNENRGVCAQTFEHFSEGPAPFVGDGIRPWEQAPPNHSPDADDAASEDGGACGCTAPGARSRLPPVAHLASLALLVAVMRRRTARCG